MQWTQVLLLLVIMIAQLSCCWSFLLRSTPRRRFSHSPLQLDVFGLGPTEVVIILVTGAVLFGPERLGKGFGKTSLKSGSSTPAWMMDQKDKIQTLKAVADEARRKRAAMRAAESLAGIEDE